MPHLSVIVPAYNRQDTIEACLKAIKNSDYSDYELIVIDCGSHDATVSISRRYASKVIEFSSNPGRNVARGKGVEAATGEIVVNVDSDIVVRADTLSRIAGYFSGHKEADAVTGLLSMEHPNPDFISQYKNLYMNYIFSSLPRDVTFLYGSIHAFRHNITEPYDSDIRIADDTALGQRLNVCGRRIVFLRDLEVIHLKKYDLLSFLKNDFQIPFDWAKIFVKYKGWRQLGARGPGFAHASKRQIISVVLAPLLLISMLTAPFIRAFLGLSPVLALIWLVLSAGLLTFLTRHRGLTFGLSAVLLTFIDNIAMATGILCGFLYSIIGRLKRL